RSRGRSARSRSPQLRTLASGTARRPMNTCGLRTVSQRVSCVSRSDSRSAWYASAVSKSSRSPPPAWKTSGGCSPGLGMEPALGTAVEFHRLWRIACRYASSPSAEAAGLQGGGEVAAREGAQGQRVTNQANAVEDQHHRHGDQRPPVVPDGEV